MGVIRLTTSRLNSKLPTSKQDKGDAYLNAYQTPQDQNKGVVCTVVSSGITVVVIIISIEGDGIVTYLTFLLWITVIVVLYWGCQVQAGDCCQWGSLSSP